MAGKKQHHIPRSLQRGFLFDVKAEKTYVHRRDGGIFPKSISDVAAKRYFYSRMSSDGSKTLDDLITDYENRLGRLLIKLRAVPIDYTIDADVAAEVIAHLTPRSANVRHIFGSGIKQMIAATAEAFSEEDTFVQILGLAEPEPNQTWHQHIEPILDKESQLKILLESLPFPKHVLDRMIFIAAKENFVGKFNATSLGITKAFTSILNRLDDMVRDGHNKALGRGLVAESRKISLKTLEWHIRAAPPLGAILPDCIALGVDEEGGSFLPYMMTDSATISAVVMPITSEKLLVGIRPGHKTPDLSDFNRDAAACSAELFIVASRAGSFAKLGAKIGERWTSEINAVAQDALKKLLPSKRLTTESIEKLLPLPPLSYQITFNGFGTEEEITPISETTQRVVAQVGRLFDLERLDGITYAMDHPAALTGLEWGFDISTLPEGVPDHIAQGAATALVLREGVTKVRIVMHVEYARSLVADNQQDAEVALHLLVAGLVQVCTLNRIEGALPNFLLAPVAMTDHDGVLHCAVRKAIRAYRYARDSVTFGADEVVEREFSKYLIGSFDHAATTITKAKEVHATNPDFHRLFDAAHEAASDMLISTARLLGHRFGMGKLEFPTAESDVGAAIAARQLANWVAVFANDLQRFWQKETWTYADFYALNIHAERVLWANGVILWREPNGQGTMIMVAPQQQPLPISTDVSL